MHTLLIHAGLPKTATTAIQGAMYEARQRLWETDRLLYPTLCKGNRDEIGRIFSRNPENHPTSRMANLKRPHDALKHQVEGLAALSREFDQMGWSRAVISAEAVSNFRRDEMEAIREWAFTYVDEIKILFWVREPVSLVTSIAQQLLKGGATLEEQFANLPLPVFKRKISTAIAVFGRDNVRVEAFESAKSMQGGVLAAFTSHIGLSEEGSRAVTGSVPSVNESMSHEAALMLNHLNVVRPLFGDTKGPRIGNEVTTFRNIKGRRFQLPLEIRRRIYEGTREEVAWLNQFFGLALYETPFNEEPDPFAAMPSETIESAALVMSDLMNEVVALRLILTANTALQRGELEQAREKATRATSLMPESNLVHQHGRRILQLTLPRLTRPRSFLLSMLSIVSPRWTAAACWRRSPRCRVPSLEPPDDRRP